MKRQESSACLSVFLYKNLSDGKNVRPAVPAANVEKAVKAAPLVVNTAIDPCGVQVLWNMNEA